VIRSDAEEGFTLPELLMAIAILAIIVAPLTLAFVTALRVVGKTDEKFTDSRGALISAAAFASDVNNANVVSTGSSPSQCGSGGTLLVTFGWSDAMQGRSVLSNNTNRVTYFYDASDPSSRKLLRWICKGAAAPRKSVAAVSLGSSAPAVSCYNPGAPSAPVACTGANVRWVKLDVSLAPNSKTPDNPAPVPFSFTLEGTRRAR
jgi:prepilin-type N-terminal cleavage/methylation domain-containing protein